MIYEFVPYDPSGLGNAYNACCQIVPNDDDWIALRDSDVMFLGRYGHQLKEVVQTNEGKFDLLTCWATRIGCPKQQHRGIINRESSLVALKRLAVEAEAQWGQVTELRGPVSGMFLLFQKRLWREFPFPSRSKSGPFLGIDYQWSKRLTEAGKRIGRIDGLLAIHYYRLGGEPADHFQ